MSYVDLSDTEKPRFEKTLVSDLPHDVIMELCMFLNPKLPTKDYKSLAGKMGLKYLYVKNLEMKPNPTEELLMHWWSGSGIKTVTALIDLLKQIDRADVIDILQKHEYTIIEKKSRPFSTASLSSTKEPTENDLSDVSSYLQSDDEDRRNSRTLSLPLSEPPEPYRSSRDTSSTVNNDDYDTDEELNRKMEAMGNGPKETSDDSSCFPYYQFRRGSNASTSTSGSACMNTGVQTEIGVHRVDVHPQPSQPSPMAGDVAPLFSQATQPTVTASDKVALLIGNQYYEKLDDIAPLMFPHKDVYDFKNVLEEELGFTVLSLVDLTLTEMRTVMLAFCKLLGPGVFALFYFAGHGYEENGENYLMPVDAAPSRSAAEFIAAQEILQEMQLAKTALNLFIIDACRVKGVNTAGTRPAGLRKINFGNTIIAYSCQSQMPAFEHQNETNGVYMKELLKKITSDRRIEHILLDVNSAVNGNPYVHQRPVFETDTIGDCRLTCPISPQALRGDRSDRWSAATKPPEPQEFPKEEEKVNFKLVYIGWFSNLLQVNVLLKNYNSSPLIIDEIILGNGEQLKTRSNSILSVVEPGNDYVPVHQFRIYGLQKITQKLLLVIQVKGTLMDTKDELLMEIKLDADYPLVAACLNEFRVWITADELPARGKNTWV